MVHHGAKWPLQSPLKQRSQRCFLHTRKKMGSIPLIVPVFGCWLEHAEMFCILHHQDVNPFGWCSRRGWQLPKIVLHAWQTYKICPCFYGNQQVRDLLFNCSVMASAEKSSLCLEVASTLIWPTRQGNSDFHWTGKSVSKESTGHFLWWYLCGSRNA